MTEKTLKTLEPNTPQIEKFPKEKIAETKTHDKWLIPAYTGSVKNKDLVFKGSIEVKTVKETDEGLKWFKTNATKKDIALRNRQALSDAKNGIRTEETEESVLAQIAKTSNLQKKLKLIGKLAKVNPTHPMVIESEKLFGKYLDND